MRKWKSVKQGEQYLQKWGGEKGQNIGRTEKISTRLECSIVKGFRPEKGLDQFRGDFRSCLKSLHSER